MTLHLDSNGRDAMFQVRFGFGGSSQLRDLVFGLYDEVNVNGGVPRRSGGCLGEFQTPEMTRL